MGFCLFCVEDLVTRMGDWEIQSVSRRLPAPVVRKPIKIARG